MGKCEKRSQRSCAAARENQKSAYAKTKALVLLDTISWSLLSCTAWFVSDLVENPNCWFLLKIFTFYSDPSFLQLRKNLYIAWACFRYGDNFSYIRIRF